MNKLPRAIRLYKPIPIEEGCAEKCRSTHHNYFKLTAKTIIALLAVLIATTLPKTAFSQSQDCEISNKGNVEQGVFQADPEGKDYKITCAQTQDLASIPQLVGRLLDTQTHGLIVGESKILIDITNDSNGQVILDNESAVYEVIFKGTITNDDAITDGRVISVSNDVPGGLLAEDPLKDVVVENRATVESQGNGRTGFAVAGVEGVNVKFTNHGTIKTSGDIHPRINGNAEFLKYPYRRSDGAVVTAYGGGDVELINHGTVRIEATARGARGLTGGVVGTAGGSSGSVTIQNFGEVTTKGDGYDFSPASPGAAADAILAYRPYGLHAYMENSDGTITITNEKDATITTKGQGARGISAHSDGSGAVTLTNKGMVTNTGGAWQADADKFISRPYGVSGGSEGGGSVTVINEGTVKTGDAVESDKANSEAIDMASMNLSGRSPGDRITDTDIAAIGVSGTFGNALMAGTEGATPGLAKVINSDSGIITTWGYNAHGMATYVDDDNDRAAGPSRASGENSGTITTHGDEADGASIIVLNSQDATSSVEVTNQADGIVKTIGAGSEGIEAVFWMSRGDATEDALGTARGTNHGTVTTTGAAAAGVNVGFWSNEEAFSSILNSGNAFVENTGIVTVSGHGSVGLNAQTHGTGNVDIKVQNGIVRAGTMANPAAEPDAIVGKFGIGIQGRARTHSDGPDDDDVDVMILVSGSSAIVQAYGADADDGTTKYDEREGIAILADSGSMTGHSVVQIQDGAKVSAFGKEGGYAVMFEFGKGTLNLINSSLVGNISFTNNGSPDEDTDDVFNIRQAGSGSIDGDINFFGGEDVMNIQIADNQHFVINGNIMGLETMKKTGSGFLRLNGDVAFEGSTLNLDEGVLVIAGELNLGTGEMTVKEAGKLIFEIDEGHNHGVVLAGSVHFDTDNPVVFAQISANVDADEVGNVQNAISTGLPFFFLSGSGAGFTSGTDKSPVTEIKVQSESSGGTENVGTVAVSGINSGMVTFTNAENIAVLDLPEMPQSGSGTSPGNNTSPGPSGDTTTTASSGSSGGGGGGGAILGLGLLAVLLNSFVGDDDASASFGDYYFNTPQSAYIASINERGVMTIKETGNQPYQMWIRTGHTAQPMQMTGVSNTGVSGTEVGVNLYNSDTFYINTSVAPNVAAEVGSLNLAGKGEVYSLNSGWRNDRYFGGLRLSHGEFEVNSIVDNPIVNSALISNAKLRNTQAQLRAGMNLGTGALRFTPSAAVQVGTYESSEHVADSPALEAAIPGYAQDYTSVQLGLKMTSDKWLSFANGSKWKPQLKFDSIHTDSTDAGSLTLRQSDKAGALSFNTNAGLRSMPDVVNSMSFGAKVKSSANDQAEWKFGFAGLEADGEEYYAAMAAYQLRF